MSASMKVAYIVVLTNGEHFTDSKNAEIIVGAIGRHEPIVHVEMDMYGDGSSTRSVDLMTRNVVMLVRCPETIYCDRFEALVGSKVTNLRR